MVELENSHQIIYDHILMFIPQCGEDNLPAKIGLFIQQIRIISKTSTS